MREDELFGLHPQQVNRVLSMATDGGDAASGTRGNEIMGTIIGRWLDSPLRLDSSLLGKAVASLREREQDAESLASKRLVDVLLDPGSDPAILHALQEHFESYSTEASDDEEVAVVVALCLAAIASLLVYHGEIPAQHNAEGLIEPFAELASHIWMPPGCKGLFWQAHQVCRPPQSDQPRTAEPEPPGHRVRSKPRTGDARAEAGASVTASMGPLLERPGTQVGRYKLLRVLGEGGMGMVYLAEQEGEIRRKVALKVIKPGMDSARVIARFEAERQALALLDHPGIAHVYDAGTTAAGRPYFVMEYVKGLPITDYCDRHKLGIEDRLRLLQEVCHGVHHAHQKGIIHRDIKPSNILVSTEGDEPIPKIIDFGVAKAIAAPLTERTLFTEDSHLLGTPEYMSPEQADMANEDIDTRSDIYSLGVLLYVLLAGILPYDSKTFREGGVEHIRKIIRETDPKTPSTRLANLGKEATSLAESRRTEVTTLAKRLHRELEWIPLKAMRKDRAERYRSASELADDIENYLGGAPLMAGPLGPSYRLRKFVQRNRGVVASGLAVATILMLATVVSVSQMISAERARKKEAQQLRRAQVEELNARRQAYASDMNLAAQALSQNNLGRARTLLNRHRPSTSASNSVTAIDLRGWEWRYLWKQAQGDSLGEFCRLTSEITSLAVSHDGSWIAVGGSDGDGVSVWDLRTREQLAVLHPEERFVRVAFSPQDRLLAFSGVPSLDTTGYLRPDYDHSCIRLWDGNDRQIIQKKLPLTGSCIGLQFSDDGKVLVSATADLSSDTDTPQRRRITVWSMPQGEELASYTVPLIGCRNGTQFVMDWSKGFAAHSIGIRWIRVTDLSTGEKRWSARATDEQLSALALTRDGKVLASSSQFSESTIRLWNVDTGEEIGRLEGHGTWVGDLHFWPDGKTLASASADQTIRLWDVSDPCEGKLIRTLRGHTAEVWRITLLPDNKTLVSGAKDGSVYIWDTQKPQRNGASVTFANTAAWCFAEDEDGILTLDRRGHVTLHKGTGLREEVPLFDVTTKFIWFRTCFSPNSRLLATGSDDGAVHIWDRQSGSTIQRLNCPPTVEPFAFLEGGNKLATVSRGADSHDIWDLATGQRTASWRGAARLSWSCTPALTPDERLSLTLCEWRGTGVLRDMKSGLVTYPSLDIYEAGCAAFSPNGNYLAAGTWLGPVKLWETEDFREVVTLGGLSQGCLSLAFSPDGRRLAASCGGLETVKVWDVQSHQELLTLHTGGSLYWRTAFSPDGNTLGSLDDSTGQLSVWQAPSWEEIKMTETSLAGGKSLAIYSTETGL